MTHNYRNLNRENIFYLKKIVLKSEYKTISRRFSSCQRIQKTFFLNTQSKDKKDPWL